MCLKQGKRGRSFEKDALSSVVERRERARERERECEGERERERIGNPKSLVFLDSGRSSSRRLFVRVRSCLFLGPPPRLLLRCGVARRLQGLAGLDQREGAVGFCGISFEFDDGVSRFVERGRDRKGVDLARRHEVGRRRGLRDGEAELGGLEREGLEGFARGVRGRGRGGEVVVELFFGGCFFFFFEVNIRGRGLSRSLSL